MTATEDLGPYDEGQLREHGISLAEAQRQLGLLRNPPPPLLLARPAIVGDGIRVIEDSQLPSLQALYDTAAAAGRASKFVPASGAASRMFRSLLPFCNGAQETHPETAEPAIQDPAVGQLLENLESFAFFPAVRQYLEQTGFLEEKGLSLAQVRAGEGVEVFLEALLTPRGMNYANAPKALIPFHSYGSLARTAFEEQLVEAAATIADTEGRCRLHFTVAEAEAEARFKAHAELAQSRDEGATSPSGHPFGQPQGSQFEISYSTQSPATDTLAVTPAGKPFRRPGGRLLLRPGGHGSLLRNLQACGGDLVFVKNIDNVVPDSRKGPTVLWKKVLGGYLLQLQERIFAALRHLDNGGEVDDEILDLLADDLEVEAHATPSNKEKLRTFARDRLHRPLRVCGVVVNKGEPGGGPYWVRGTGGGTEASASLQIVEGAQIDTSVPSQGAAFRGATHFNPVDLVCGLRDHRGQSFDLDRFQDPATAFITKKSHGGRPLLALEHPGLWNGAMARWNTIFVEVPAETFAPVKTVFDLLRPEHQS